MAHEQIPVRDLGSMMDALPRTQLVEISRQAALVGFKRACDRVLGERTLESVIAAVFADLPHSRIAEVAGEMGLCAIRNSVWKQLLSLPGQWKVSIRCPDRDAVQALRAREGPVILAFWHMGAANMLPLGLQSVGIPALIISTVPPSPWFTRSVSPEMKIIVAKDDPKQAAMALKQALDRLRKGGVAALAVDGSQGAKDIVVPFLGRRFTVSRGVAVLARITGAPVIPCLMTWAGADWSMDFRIFDPVPLPPRDSLTPEAFERAVLEAAVQRFEEVTRSLPGQLRVEQLTRVADAPRLAPAE